MKNRQRTKAKELYIAAVYNNSEIAAQVGVNRRTIMLWARAGNWQQQRELDQQLPALLAERSYLLANSLTSSLLTRNARPVHLRDAKAIYYLATGISKLKGKPDELKRREMFSRFISIADSKRAPRRLPTEYPV